MRASTRQFGARQAARAPIQGARRPPGAFSKERFRTGAFLRVPIQGTRAPIWGAKALPHADLGRVDAPERPVRACLSPDRGHRVWIPRAWRPSRRFGRVDGTRAPIWGAAGRPRADSGRVEAPMRLLRAFLQLGRVRYARALALACRCRAQRHQGTRAPPPDLGHIKAFACRSEAR